MQLSALLQRLGTLHSHSLTSQHSHFTDKKTEAQKQEGTCPKSHDNTMTARTGPGSWAGWNQHATSQAGTEELLGLAWPRDMRNGIGHTALTDAEWPGPGSGQSGGRNVELEAGSPDLVARHHPGSPVTLGRPLTSGASAPQPVPWGQNHTSPTCPWVAMRLKQWENTLEAIKCWTSLSFRPYPVYFCTCILHAQFKL